jgi:hypothetical protein
MTSCSTNTCGVGGWGGPLPGDPSNDLVLSAVPVLAGIEVSWSYPTTNPQAVAFVKLLRGSSANVESAIEIARVAGSSYYDRQDNNNTWYYWIRVTSSNGTEADLIGPASAAAVPTAGQLVELVQGAITSSALHASLGEKIELITAVDTRLDVAIANREEAEGLLAEALAQANDAIDYVTNTLVVENAERVAAVGAAVDAIDQEVLDRINSDDAVKTELRAEFSEFMVDASGEQITAAANSYTQNYTYNKATIDGSITFAGQQLKSDYETKDSATLTSANAYTNTYTYAKATVDSSIATAVTNLTTAFAAGDSATRADTREYAYGKSTVDSAIAAASSTLTTAFTGADATNLSAAKTYAEGYVQSYSYSRSTIDGNISSLGTSLTSAFNAGLAAKNKVFRQSAQPTAAAAGDVWINTTAGANNEMRAWDGSAWQPVTDPRIASTAASLTNDYYTKTAADSAIAFSASALTTAFQGADAATNANLSNNYYTKSAADSAMAVSATALEAKLRVRQNLLRNGGFENGMEFWSSGTPGWGLVDGVWGRTCQNSSINTTTVGVLDSTYQIPVQPGQTYTISADTVLFATTGSLYVDLLFFNSSNVVVGDGGERNRSATHDFTDTDTGRLATEFAVVAPATAAYARARFVWGGITGLTVIGRRQVKVERGGLPSTPYSSEATLTYSNARIDSVSSALTTTTSSVASTANTLRTEFANADATTYSNAQSYVQGYAYSKTTVDSAIATKGDQLTTAFQNADSAINANLTTNYYTKSAANEAVATAITQLQATVGADFVAMHSWDFSGNHNGWNGSNTTFQDFGGSTVVTLTGTDPMMMTDMFSPISGYTYNKVRMRLRKNSGGPADWEGVCYYQNTGGTNHSWSHLYFKAIPKPVNLDSGAWCIVEWDMGALTVGGDDWLLSSINAIRIDLEHTGGRAYEIDWIAIGRHGVPVSEATVTEMNSAIASGDAANAVAIQQLGAKVVVRPNLLLNGGWEKGTEGWRFTHHTGSPAPTFTVGDSAAWGRVINFNGSFSGVGVIEQDISIAEGWPMVFTVDSEFQATSGKTYTDILFLNPSGTLLGSAGGTRLGPHGFSSDGANRVSHTSAGTSPPGTSIARCRCVYDGIVGGTYIAFRMAKAEFGNAPATPYTAERTLIALDANIKTVAQTSADQNSAQASLITNVQAVIGTNRPNLLKNGGFEAGDFRNWPDRSGGSSWVIDPSIGNWGTVAYVGNGAVPGNHYMLSDPIYVSPQQPYTVSADSEMFCSGGAIYIRPLAFNAGGSILEYGAGHYRNGQHGFGTRTRAENSNQFTPPAGTAYIRIEVLFFNMVSPSWMAVRQIKVEKGALPATPYSTEATVAQAYSAIQTEASVRADQTGNLFAKYTVKIDQNGYVTGYGLASETNNGSTVSSFQVRADRFSIASPTGPGITPIVPFAVLTTPTVENGVTLSPGVYMDGLFIKNVRADRIDTRGLTVKDNAGNIILGSGSALSTSYVPSAALNSSISVSNGRLVGIGGGDGALVDNTKLADNLIPDPFYLNSNWWGVSSWANLNATVGTGGAVSAQPANYLVLFPAAGDVSGQWLPVEKGATYRLKIRIYASPAAAGIFWFGLHLPNLEWFTPVPLNGGATSNPEFGFNFDAVGTNGASMRGNWTEFVATRTMSGLNQIQTRLRNVLSAGYVEVHMELTRIFSFDNLSEVGGKIRSGTASTFIDNAALNYAQIGELRAQNISVAEVSRAVNGGAVGARVDIDGNRVRVFDGVNSFPRVTLGYLG